MYRRCIPTLLPFNVSWCRTFLWSCSFPRWWWLPVFLCSVSSQAHGESAHPGFWGREPGLGRSWTRGAIVRDDPTCGLSDVRLTALWITFKLFEFPQGKKVELKRFIVELSKEYSILSQFTSFVAIEERVGAVLLSFGSTATATIWSYFPVFIQEPVTSVWGCDFFDNVQICDVLPQNPVPTLKRPPLALLFLLELHSNPNISINNRGLKLI